MNFTLYALLFVSLLILGSLLALLLAALRILKQLHPSPSSRTRGIVVDPSAMGDMRLFELAQSGLLDERLIIPRFLLKDHPTAQEVARRLAASPHLHLRYSDTDFPEVKEIRDKLLKLARELEADLLYSDTTRFTPSAAQEVRTINLHELAHSLRPLKERGEYMNVAIARYGKDDNQGVGYLEDGTMIVVNGGAEHLGKVIRVCVLSVKPTVSGRIIFCNVAQDECIPT